MNTFHACIFLQSPCFSVCFIINTHAEDKMRVTSGKIYYILGSAIKFSCVIEKVHCDDGCHISASVIIRVSVTASHSLNQYPGLRPFICHLKGLKNQDHICERLLGMHIFGLALLLSCLRFCSFALSPACSSWRAICYYSMQPAIGRCFVTP